VNEALTQLTLRQPWWLLLLLIPLCVMLIRRVKPRSHQHHQRLAQFIDPSLWRWLLTRPHNPHPQMMSWLLLLAWSLIAIAASGPHFSDSRAAEVARSIDIAVIVDISPSMAADDVAPSRLGRAKLELRDFSARLKADRTALIAYSANAYPVLPLTPDRDTLHHFSDALDTTLTRKRGSNLTQALERAIQLLDHSAQQGRAIVLLTDGESYNPQADLNVAKRLHKKQLPLLIVGIGTHSGGMIPNQRGRVLQHDGEPVITRLDSVTLQQLATTSGGIYTAATDNDDDWDTIFSALDQLEPLNPYRAPYQPQQFQFFPWLMGVAILLFLISGVRQQRGSVAILIIPLLMFAPTPPAQANTIVDHWNEAQAYRALTEGRHAEAAYRYSEIESYRAQLGYGVAAYRQQEWQVAAEAFARAAQFAVNNQQRAQANYNRGNALSRLNQLDDAANAYEVALKYQSNFSRAALNLSLVNKARAQQGGVQKRDQQKPPQAAMNATQDSNAEQQAAQLDQPDPQGTLRGRQSEPQQKESLQNEQQQNEQASQQALPSQQKSELEPSPDQRNNAQSINWENALQQAQAINKRLGYEFMRRRFNLQEGDTPLKAEEKPW